MARRQPPPPQPKPANLTPQQMRAALPKLQRRLDDLKAIDTKTIRDRGDPRMDALEQKIDDTLAEIFGHDTVEYQRFRVGVLDTAPLNMFGDTPLESIQKGYQRGIEQAISTISTVAELFQEKIQDLGEDPAGRAVRAFGDLDVHPEIGRAVEKLFRDGHYANAVEDACKVLDGLVKIRSGRFDLGGTDLMQTVFSPKTPVLRFNQLTTETDKSEQQGMMFLFAGAMLALRNPRAHELMQDDPEQAIEYLSLLSMLAKALDRAERV